MENTALGSRSTGAICYFLSRPRRFGKSLLPDTVKELFEGSESLFPGLRQNAKPAFPQHRTDSI